MTVLHYRGIGHPWTAEPGWDQLMISADDDAALDELIARAKDKFWKVWYRSAGIGPDNRNAQPRVHMFKPSDRTSDWQDVAWQGTPRGHGHQFRVGDEVYTDFSSTLTRRRVTQHRITEIDFRTISQTGVVLRVTPPVPGSSYVTEDRGALHPGQPKGNPWIDSAWFRRVE